MIVTIKTLPHYFPEVFAQRIILSVIILLGLFALFIALYFRKRISKNQLIVSLVLCAYIVTVYYFTVIGRYSSEIYRNEIYFFYSYPQLFERFDRESIKQILINLLVLLPVGFMLPFIISGKMRYFWTFLISFCISISIELLQIIMVCGTFELDDILNNVIGACMGIGIYILLNNFIGFKKEKP